MFPVGRVKRHLKKACAARLGKTAPVYMAAVLEYVAAELLELSGRVSWKDRKHRIIPRHIYLAIQNDEELLKVVSESIIPAGGTTENYMKVIGGYRTVESALKTASSPKRKKTKSRTATDACGSTAKKLKFD